MEQPDSTFLATIAQLSGTFIGFCLLIPIVQAMGREAFEDQEKPPLITSKTRFVKSMWIFSLPVFVLMWPLVYSLLLITLGQGFFENNISRAFNFVMPGINISHFVWVLFISKMQASNCIFKFLFEFTPFSLIFLYPIIYALIVLASFSFQYKELLMLVTAGLLLVLRNLTITLEQGLRFKPNELNKREFERFFEKFKKDINDALENRRKIVRELTARKEKVKDKWIRRRIELSIGEYKAEIQSWEEYRNKIEEDYNKIKEKRSITLSEANNLESWIRDLRMNLRKFKHKTQILKMQIAEVYGVENG